MNQEIELRQAEFNPKVKTYWFLSGMVLLFSTIFGVLLIPVWWIAAGRLTTRWLNALECRLTDRAVKFKKGVFIRVEKTVPLEKITDVGLVQGPIMRYLNLEALSIETAGQSTPGAYLRIVGIENTRAFRDAVLEQREKHSERLGHSMNASTESQRESGPGAQEKILIEIRDTLRNIEARLRGD